MAAVAETHVESPTSGKSKHGGWHGAKIGLLVGVVLGVLVGDPGLFVLCAVSGAVGGAISGRSLAKSAKIADDENEPLAPPVIMKEKSKAKAKEVEAEAIEESAKASRHAEKIAAKRTQKSESVGRVA